MRFIEKKKVLKDQYILSSIINCLGIIVCSYLLFKMFLMNSLFVIIPIVLFYTMRSVFPAFLRWMLILRFNEEVLKTEKLARMIMKTHSLIKNSGRELYKKRFILLTKALENRLESFQYFQKSIDALKSGSYEHVEMSGIYITQAEIIINRKIFINKK